MIDIVDRYVKTCFHCKGIKNYKNSKQNLLKFLFISERYFQNNFVNFITFLFVCLRHDRNYQYIMIVMNRLFKKIR